MSYPQVDDAWEWTSGEGPLVAAAVHNGHALRHDVASRMALSPDERLREEDPFTGRWTEVAPTRVIVKRSRFEVDLNRPREKAVYQHPREAWGLEVWKGPLPEEVVAQSLGLYDEFYAAIRSAIAEKVRRYGTVVVLDLHSYNYRRIGPQGPPDDPVANPDINIGTGTMDRPRWGPLVDRVLRDLRTYDALGRRLDVRENVRFLGGHFPRWLHETFPDSVCALAIEVKKFFMDEWTGELNEREFGIVGSALASVVPGLHEELMKLDESRKHFPRHVRRAD